MKNTNTSRRSVALLLLSLAGCANVGRPPAAKVPDQIVELKVLEVLAVSDEYASSCAYVMNWNGQEIAVRAPSSGMNYQVGDSVSVLVQHRASSLGRKNDYRILHFKPMATLSAELLQSQSSPSLSLSDLRQLNSGLPINLKVLQVFSAQDGEAVFRAYRVNWRGQDVVVWDALARYHYEAGDQIRVRVGRLPPPGAPGAPLELVFSAAGPEPVPTQPLVEPPIGSMGPLP